MSHFHTRQAQSTTRVRQKLFPCEKSDVSVLACVGRKEDANIYKPFETVKTSSSVTLSTGKSESCNKPEASHV